MVWKPVNLLLLLDFGESGRNGVAGFRLACMAIRRQFKAVAERNRRFSEALLVAVSQRGEVCGWCVQRFLLFVEMARSVPRALR